MYEDSSFNCEPKATNVAKHSGILALRAAIIEDGGLDGIFDRMSITRRGPAVAQTETDRYFNLVDEAVSEEERLRLRQERIKRTGEEHIDFVYRKIAEAENAGVHPDDAGSWVMANLVYAHAFPTRHDPEEPLRAPSLPPLPPS